MPCFLLRVCLWAYFPLLCYLFANIEANSTRKGKKVYFPRALSIDIQVKRARQLWAQVSRQPGSSDYRKKKSPFWRKWSRNMNYTKGASLDPSLSFLFSTTPVNSFQPNTFFSALLTARIVHNLLAEEAVPPVLHRSNAKLGSLRRAVPLNAFEGAASSDLKVYGFHSVFDDVFFSFLFHFRCFLMCKNVKKKKSTTQNTSDKRVSIWPWETSMSRHAPPSSYRALSDVFFTPLLDVLRCRDSWCFRLLTHLVSIS